MKVFKDCGLTITTQTNLKIVNFLDVQLNLGTSTYLPNRNPDSNPVYQGKSWISAKINRKTYIRYITEWKCFCTVNTYISRSFTKLKYIASDNSRENKTEEKKRNKRKTIWSNPLCSVNVRTNLDKTFLKLIRKHFPNGNPSHNIINKNTLKVSYSCMGKMASVIS